MQKSFTKYIFKKKIILLLQILFGVYGYTYIRFLLTHRYAPQFKTPRSMNEKLIHRKMYDDPKKFSKYASKLKVREYVTNTINEEILVPLLKAKKHITRDDFNDLPNSFVIKVSNAGGANGVLIVKDKNSLDLNEICHRFNKQVKNKIGKHTGEFFYDLEENLILFETLLIDPQNNFLIDYKFHIFNNEGLSKIFIQVDFSHFSEYRRSIFDENTKRCEFYWGKYKPIPDNFKFPDNVDKMIDIVKKLSQPFKYARIDLYNVDGKIYFSEITFCNDSGYGVFSTKKIDFVLGKMWKEYNK